MEERPEISVVTVCLNAAATLEQTIESVAAQSHPALEYVVVDGGSSDGTLDIIRRHQDLIAHWISEPDEGISDAMNKGIALSQGELLFFLQADDYLIGPDALAKASAAIAGSDVDIYAFDLLKLSGDQQRHLRPRPWNAWINLKTPLLHQATLCRRRLFERIGGFDTTLRIAMDYEFFLRAYRADASIEYRPLTLAAMRDTGISSRLDWPSLRRRFAEERQLQLAHAGGPLSSALYRLYWPGYLAYRRLRTMIHGTPRSRTR